MTLLEIAGALLAEAADAGITVRALGGAGVALRCPSARHAPLVRGYSDLDVATRGSDRRAIAPLVDRFGYEPDGRFNALNGERRLLFLHATDGHHLDVFIDTFEMCHTLDLRRRLTATDRTLAAADLLLTKLQVASLAAKDVADTVALLLDCEFTPDDSGINIDHVTGILAADWGWWRTTTENVRRVRDLAPALGLDKSQADVLLRRLTHLEAAIERRPKALRWRARARLGERVPWREDPETS